MVGTPRRSDMKLLIRVLCLGALLTLVTPGILVGQEAGGVLTARDQGCVVRVCEHAGDPVIEWYATGGCVPARVVLHGSRVIALNRVGDGLFLVVEVVGAGADAKTKLSVLRRLPGAEPELQWSDSVAVDGFEAKALGRIGPIEVPESWWVLVNGSGDRLLTFEWTSEEVLPARAKMRLFEGLDIPLARSKGAATVEPIPRGFRLASNTTETAVAVVWDGRAWSVEPRQFSGVPEHERGWWVMDAPDAPTEGCMLVGVRTGRDEEVRYRLATADGAIVLSEGVVKSGGAMTINVPSAFRFLPGMPYSLLGDGVTPVPLRPILKIGDRVDSVSVKGLRGLGIHTNDMLVGGSVDLRAIFECSTQVPMQPPRAFVIVAALRSDNEPRASLRGPLLKGLIGHDGPLKPNGLGIANLKYSLRLPGSGDFSGVLLAFQVVVEDARGDFAFSEIVGACIQPAGRRPASVVNAHDYAGYCKGIATGARADEFTEWLRERLPKGASGVEELYRRFESRRQSLPRPK